MVSMFICGVYVGRGFTPAARPLGRGRVKRDRTPPMSIRRGRTIRLRPIRVTLSDVSADTFDSLRSLSMTPKQSRTGLGWDFA